MAHFKNTCPKCNEVTQCRCMGERTLTNNICEGCNAKADLNEDAVAGSISAGAIAGVRGMLFTGIKELTNKKARKVAGVPVITFKDPEKNLNRRTLGIAESRKMKFSEFISEEAEFDMADVFSKLSQNSKIVGDLNGEELAVFGMESDDGAVTKVYVPKEQGKDFEIALSNALKHTKGSTGGQEIAGILFDLKDQFRIVDVKWPTVQEDEEQQATPAPAPADTNNPAAVDPNAAPADPNNPTPVDPNAAPDLGAPATTPDTGDMIAQILDMLRADAEARKADADAKTADAHAREAESTAKIAGIKMQGEEEVLDAEAYFKEKKDEKREAERIKMLARFRQEQKMSDDTASIPKDAIETLPTPAVTPALQGKTGNSEEEERITRARHTLLSILGGM